jgi:hypothetical protein
VLGRGALAHRPPGDGQARHGLLQHSLRERVGQPDEAFERAVDAEARAGGDAHAVVVGDRGQGGAARRVELDPQAQPARREREAPLGRQCRGQRVATGAKQLALAGQDVVGLLEQLGRHELLDHRAGQVERGAGRDEAVDRGRGGADPADAQAAPVALAHRAGHDRGLARGVEGGDGRRRAAVEVKLGHRLVDRQRGAGGAGERDEPLAIPVRQREPGRVVVIGH